MNHTLKTLALALAAATLLTGAANSCDTTPTKVRGEVVKTKTRAGKFFLTINTANGAVTVQAPPLVYDACKPWGSRYPSCAAGVPTGRPRP